MPTITEDGRRRLYEAASTLREAKIRVTNLEASLAEAKREVTRLQETEVLDLLDSMGTDRFGVPPEGNEPGYDLIVAPFYEGGIAASWDEKRQEEGFATLEAYGHGGLIKTLVTIQVPRDPASAKKVEALVAAADKLRLDAEVKKGVHHSTFKSWLKGEVESGRPLPPLEKIGAMIGRRVTLKERKQ